MVAALKALVYKVAELLVDGISESEVKHYPNNTDSIA